MGGTSLNVARRPSLATSLVALDTNTLLLPYTATSHSIDAVEKVYAQLAREGRVVIPTQVAMEYERNRSKKLGELFQALQITMSKAPPSAERYPLLEGLESWKAALEALAESAAAFKKAQGHLRSVREVIRGWDRADPVLEAYVRAFNGVPFAGHLQSNDDVRREAERRYAAKIPPGYKDAAKDDGGIGDLEIWLTLIEVAKANKRDLVFVTSDEKSDWFHQSGGESLFPRHELLREFRDATSREFDLIRLSRLLEVMNAPKDVVDDVKEQEHEAIIRREVQKAMHAAAVLEVARKPKVLAREWEKRRSSSTALRELLALLGDAASVGSEGSIAQSAAWNVYVDLQAIVDGYVFPVEVTSASVLLDVVKAIEGREAIFSKEDFGNRWVLEEARSGELIGAAMVPGLGLGATLETLGVTRGAVLRPRLRRDGGDDLLPLREPQR